MHVIGSWKIIAIWRPRTSSSLRSDSFVRSRPSNVTEPSTIFAGGFGMRPMIESAVTDFPQPDSPTMPSVLPFSTGKRDAVHRLDDALAGEEVRLQVVDLEQRHGGLGFPRAGSRASRRPSAMKFAQRTSVAIATLGITISIGWFR